MTHACRPRRKPYRKGLTPYYFAAVQPGLSGNEQFFYFTSLVRSSHDFFSRVIQLQHMGSSQDQAASLTHQLGSRGLLMLQIVPCSRVSRRALEIQEAAAVAPHEPCSSPAPVDHVCKADASNKPECCGAHVDRAASVSVPESLCAAWLCCRPCGCCGCVASACHHPRSLTTQTPRCRYVLQRHPRPVESSGDKHTCISTGQCILCDMQDACMCTAPTHPHQCNTPVADMYVCAKWTGLCLLPCTHS